jgi:hypothetical protein
MMTSLLIYINKYELSGKSDVEPKKIRYFAKLKKRAVHCLVFPFFQVRRIILNFCGVSHSNLGPKILFQKRVVPKTRKYILRRKLRRESYPVWALKKVKPYRTNKKNVENNQIKTL